MRLILAGDFHGTFKGIKEQHLKNCDAIISPGDFGDTFSRKLKFDVIRHNKENLENKIEWYELPGVGKRKAWELIQKELKSARNILWQLNDLGIPVYIVPGNADYYKKDHGWKKESKNYYHERLIKGLKNIHDCQNRLVNLGGLQIIGYGICSGNEIPMTKKDKKELTKKELGKKQRKYEKQFEKTEKLFKRATKPTIFLSHNVPYNTKIDRITWKESPAYGRHFGSVITRQMIEKYGKKILFCVGGHMHEHFTKTKLNNVTCINSGAGYEGKYVVVDVEGNKIKKIEFV